jgi:HAD superfamily hydrolase (TIGR01456 family)
VSEVVSDNKMLCRSASKLLARAVKPNQTVMPRRWNSTAGIAFDIDGVFYRGKDVIPGASRALQRLEEHKIPHIFMTNGGGVTEQKKAESLSGILSDEATILGEQMLLCHTPMQELASTYRDDLILLVGKNNSRAIMSAYGFDNTITVDELHAQFPSLHAESPVTPTEPIEAFRQPIKAVFCLLDPQDYLRDLQIVTDVLRSDNGMVGTLKAPGSPQLPLFFS